MIAKILYKTIIYYENNKTRCTTYTYTVRCLDSKGNFASGYDKNGTRNTFIAPPAISKVSKAGKGNLVEWKSVPKAAGYRLYRKAVNTSWSRLADVCEGTSYTDTSAKRVMFIHTHCVALTRTVILSVHTFQIQSTITTVCLLTEKLQ